MQVPAGSSKQGYGSTAAADKQDGLFYFFQSFCFTRLSGAVDYAKDDNFFWTNFVDDIPT